MNDKTKLGSTCVTCGEVELTPDQVWLVIATVPACSRYSFSCPRCSQLVSHHADAQVISVLARLVPVEELDVPAEALEEHAAAGLTVDDLLDLILDLSRDDALSGLAGAGAGAAARTP